MTQPRHCRTCNDRFTPPDASQKHCPDCLARKPVATVKPKAGKSGVIAGPTYYRQLAGWGGSRGSFS